MNFSNWWRRKSGRAKTVTVLAVVLLLQIGLCFGTPEATSWFDDLFRIHRDDPFYALGWMMFEALLCIVTVIVLFVVAFGFTGLFPDTRDTPRLFPDNNPDERRK
jgi:hypothetical protein